MVAWSAGSIGSSCLLSLKAESARQGSLVVGVRFKSISFVVGDEGGSKMGWSRRVVAELEKAGENAMARGTAQDANIGNGGEGHGGFETTTFPNENHLVAEVDGVSTAEVSQLLAVVLRRQKPQWTGGDIVGLRYREGLAFACVVQNGPVDGANASSAGSTIKTFNSDG
jgi:hypothetical protein